MLYYHTAHIFIHTAHLFIHMAYLFIHTTHLFIHTTHLFIYTAHLFSRTTYLFILTAHLFIHLFHSSLSSCANSMSCIIWEDFFKGIHYFRTLPDHKATNVVKIICEILPRTRTTDIGIRGTVQPWWKMHNESQYQVP